MEEAVQKEEEVRQTSGNQEEDEVASPTDDNLNSLPLSQRRVKVFDVDCDTGDWVDRGTGYCCIIEQEKRLMVSAETCENNTLVETFDDILVDTVILDNSEYTQQKESIITWQAGDRNVYRAISFQNPQGCDTTWQFISTCVPHLIGREEAEEECVSEVLEVPTKRNLDKLMEQLETLGRDY
eukprot:GHVS01029387.1.p1 GENE.GHVS01029387.1~~GHVS01029387.1.p1  ORF type:complete len:182 (+),score=32.63 GHVS01029387.1:25-570(+)